MDLKNPSTGDISLQKLQRMAAELLQAASFLLRVLNAALEVITNILGRVLGSSVVRKHFHLMLSGLVLFGPALSFWVSKYSVFANGNNYLYRKFLRSTWGWTWLLSGSFLLLLSLSARCSFSLSLRHLSRIGLAGVLWRSCGVFLSLLEDAAGTCYQPVTSSSQQDPQSSSAHIQPLLLLHEDQTKASCLGSGMLWRGYEVSQDVLVLCFCCLLLVEELSIFGRHLAHVEALQRKPGGPLRFIFLLCAVLLFLWLFLLLCLLAYFPKCPSQQLGGAVGYLGWRGLYQGWFGLRPSWLCPGSPGQGLFTLTEADKQTQLNAECNGNDVKRAF